MRFYDFIYKMFHRPVTALFRVTETGAENVPDEGGYLLCSNHTSLTDVMVIPAMLKVRRPKFMAKKELFKIPLLKQLITALGAFPVDRGGADVGAIKKAISLIGQGEIVSMFPQGHRFSGVDARGTTVHHGCGLIAYRAKCPVIPVYIKTKAKQVKPFRRTEVIFGKPIMPEEFAFTEGGSEEYKRAAALIFDRICDLGEPETALSAPAEKSALPEAAPSTPDKPEADE